MNGAGPSARWAQARRILCVRLDSLDGMLLSTPAMRALRAGAPGRSLTLLGSPAGAAALPFIAELDDAIAARLPGQDDPALAEVPVTALAARRFDAAIVFTACMQDARPAVLLCRRAGIPLSLAYCRGDPGGLPGDWVADPEPAPLVRHEVQRQLALVRHAGCAPASQRLSFAPRRGDIDAVRGRLTASGIDPGRPWLLLHPGAATAARAYPPAHWARVLRLLAHAPGWPLVLAGSAADTVLVDGIVHAAGLPAPPTVSLAGRLDLGELGAALQLAALAVASHGAPAHVAAAVGTPLVDLYALAEPHTMPWAVPNRVLFADVSCRFCRSHICLPGHHGCLDGVGPERVAGAVLALLETHPERSP